MRGAIFESYVASELTKSFTNVGRDAPLFCWRDARGREIDILVDLGDSVLPIEVMSGLTVASDAAKTLEWWTKLPGNTNRNGLLIHGGEITSTLQGFRILPWYLG